MDASPAAAAGDNYAVTTVINKDGTVETKRTDFSPEADGKVHAGADLSAVMPGSGPALILHDHEPVEKKTEPAPASK